MIAYRNIISENIINIPKYKDINIHFSLLPKYKGAVPINWAIINRDKETGISIFFITKNVDDGYNSQKNIIILDNDNSVILTEKLIKIGKKF